MVDYNFKPRLNPNEYGWYSRGYLPHFDRPQQPQLLTFRLFDSMPQELLDKWRRIVTSDVQFRKRIEKYLDAGFGECWLPRPDIATMVCNSLRFHHSKSMTCTRGW